MRRQGVTIGEAKRFVDENYSFVVAQKFRKKYSGRRDSFRTSYVVIMKNISKAMDEVGVRGVAQCVRIGDDCCGKNHWESIEAVA